MTDAEALERLRACLDRMRQRYASQRAPRPSPSPLPRPTTDAVPPPPWQDQEREP